MKAIISPVAIKFYTSEESKQEDLLQVLKDENIYHRINSDGYIVCQLETPYKLWTTLLTVCEHMKVEIIETQY